jgi:hypothetical protein
LSHPDQALAFDLGTLFFYGLIGKARQPAGINSSQNLAPCLERINTLNKSISPAA